MPLILSGNVASATAVAGYDVANSCRFDGSSASMSITPGSNMNLDRWTWSGWIKRGTLGVVQSIFAADNATSDYTELMIDADDKLNFLNLVSNAIKGKKITTRVLRDPSAWYHIVVVWDSGNATAGDRIKIYINGVRETVFDTSADPDQDTDSSLGEGNIATLIGVFVGESSRFWNGYMAEVVLIDGTAYAASDFGEFDDDSPTIWKPKDVSELTFGTHGFYLDFEASDNLGNDANGGTDLSETNLAATDQTVDTPTNNFCTINPLDFFPNAATLLEGNTTYSKSSTGAGHNEYASCTLGAAAGKWYFELKVGDGNAFHAGMVGMPHGKASSDGGYSSDSGLYAMNSDGAKTVAGSDTSSATNTVTTNDIVGMAFDLDNGKFYMSKNGTWENSGDPTSGATGTGSLGDITLGEFFVPMIGNRNYNATSLHYFNFGNPSYSLSSAVNDGNGYGNFEYAVPSGYLALCTKNLGSDGG